MSKKYRQPAAAITRATPIPLEINRKKKRWPGMIEEMHKLVYEQGQNRFAVAKDYAARAGMNWQYVYRVLLSRTEWGYKYWMKHCNQDSYKFEESNRRASRILGRQKVARLSRFLKKTPTDVPAVMPTPPDQVSAARDNASNENKTNE